LRIVDRFYQSSKTYSQCGKVKNDLKLYDRVYKCDCGFTIDRNLNASINLKNAKKYKIA
ncbi:zinc ribbon domain-containing protein, partial [Clostridium perfringens]|uniref:zinc ribbon domain-containing protein n=1 Tax=Clostridium perfringens TaxID=1502 RepID=UPI002468B2DC